MLKRRHKAKREGTKGKGDFKAYLTKVYVVETIEDVIELAKRADELPDCDAKLVIDAVNCGMDLRHRARMQTDDVGQTQKALLANMYLALADKARLAEIMASSNPMEKLTQVYDAESDAIHELTHAPRPDSAITTPSIADEWEERPDDIIR